MTTTLEQIADRQRDQEADIWERYTQLLRAIANDCDYDVDDAARVLTAAGKSESDLRQDLATLRSRTEHRKNLDRAPAAATRLREVERSLAKHQAEFDAARQRFEEATRPLCEERWQLHQTLETARSAERRLRQTVLDRSLDRRRERLEQKLKAVQERGKHLPFDLNPTEYGSPAFSLERAKEAVAQAADALQAKQQHGTPETIAMAERELAAASEHLDGRLKLVANLQAAKRQLDKDRELLHAELTQLRAEELEP